MFKALKILTVLVVLLIAAAAIRMATLDYTVQALDCSGGSAVCVDGSVSYSKDSCIALGQKDLMQVASCLVFGNSLKEVSLIADPYNLVRAPFTTEKFDVSLVSDQLSNPTDLAFLPDGSIIVTEKEGAIKILNGSAATVIGQIDVLHRNRCGLLAIGVSPDYQSDGLIYVYYTYALDNSDPAFENPSQVGTRRVLNRLSRFRVDGSSIGEETVLIDQIPGTLWHSGSAISFGPDGNLYVATGDAEEHKLAQDPAFLGGKVLRANPDGSIPDDNPIPGSYAYSMGHRNPEGLSWNPVTGKLYSAEHGNWRYDQVNALEPGTNYGWGSWACDRYNTRNHTMLVTTMELLPIPAPDDVGMPVFCSKQWTLAPSGIDFVTDENSPYFGDLFVASLRGRHLHRFVLDGDQLLSDEIFFVCAGKDYINEDVDGKISCRIRGVRFHDGHLYVMGEEFGLVKLEI